MEKYYYTPGTYEDRLNKLFNNNKIKPNVTLLTETYSLNNFTSTILSTIYDTTIATITTSQNEEIISTISLPTLPSSTTAKTTTTTTTATTTEVPEIRTTLATTILTTLSDEVNIVVENITDYFDSSESEFTTLSPNSTTVLLAPSTAPELVRLFVLIVILLLILISVSLNSLTLHILINNATLSIQKHYTNLAILCLTLANLSTAVFVGVPFLVKSLHTCKVQTYFKDLNQIGVLGTLLVIFVDRGIVHIYPTYKWVSRKRYGSILLFIWLHALILSFFSNYQLFTTDTQVCPSENQDRSSFGFITQIIYLYSLPIASTLSIMIILIYTEFIRKQPINPGMSEDIIWEITNRHRPIHNLFNARPDLPRVMTIQTNNSTEPNQVLICYILVTLIYYILHIPNAVMFLGGSNLQDSTALLAIISLANLISSTVNPLIYFILRKDFKSAYTNALAWEDVDRVSSRDSE